MLLLELTHDKYLYLPIMPDAWAYSPCNWMAFGLYENFVDEQIIVIVS